MMMTVKMMGVFIGSRGPFIYCTSSSSAQAVLTTIYNEACAFSRYKARSDWLILRHHSAIMSTGRLRTIKEKTKRHQIN